MGRSCPITDSTCDTIFKRTGLNRHRMPTLLAAVPPLPPKRSDGHGAKAIPLAARRSWRWELCSLDGLHRSAYALLTDVLENEFEGEVPLEAREATTEALLPQVRQLCAQSERTEESLYTEITGMVVLYLERHGI